MGQSNMKTCAQTDSWQFCMLSAENKGHETKDGQAFFCVCVFASNKVKYKLKPGKANEERSIRKPIIRVLKKAMGRGGEYFWLCKWTLCPRARLLPRAGGNTKSRTLSQYWVACAVKGRCCCPWEQSNKSCTLLHSSIPFLPSCPVVPFLITNIVLRATEGHDSFRI